MPARAADGIFVAIIVALGSIAFQTMRGKNLEYECQECGVHFSPSPVQVALTPHRMGAMLLTCPECGAGTWATPVPGNDANRSSRQGIRAAGTNPPGSRPVGSRIRSAPQPYGG